MRCIFELAQKKEELQKLEHLTLDPNFWHDAEKAKKVQIKIGLIQNPIDGWQRCQDDLEEVEILLELAHEEHDEETEQEATIAFNKLVKLISSFELECLFSGEHDTNNAMISINAGAGGTEAQDWVDMLLRMYLRWCEKKQFSTAILDSLPGDEAGIKNVTIMVKGNFAYGYLKAEMGIHRLVRISPFDTSGRRHTSFASVFIFPELDDDIAIDLDEKDLRIDTYRASGAGGQHLNKTSSAIRITHLPSNIVVQCQNERSQHRNKDVAMKMLKSRLYEKEKEAQAEQHNELAGEKKNISWGSQIRSYIMQPYRLIKDHRTGTESGNVEAVMDGDIDQFIKAYLLWQDNKTS